MLTNLDLVLKLAYRDGFNIGATQASFEEYEEELKTFIEILILAHPLPTMDELRQVRNEWYRGLDVRGVERVRKAVEAREALKEALKPK